MMALASPCITSMSVKEDNVGQPFTDTGVPLVSMAEEVQ